MAILDVRSRGLDGLSVWVTDFEASWGKISFWAREVVNRDRVGGVLTGCRSS